MNNNDLKQLRIKIRINLDNQHWIEYDIGHYRYIYHKLNGPALMWSNGSKFWLANNTYHRTNGPAIIEYNSNNAWYLNDKLIKSYRYE